MEYEIRYDPDADVLSIILRDKGELSHAEECGDFVIHMDKEGRPLLIEVLRARNVVKEISGNSIFSTSSRRYLIKNKRPF